MSEAAAAARAILSSLHEIMASREDAQGKLDRVVNVIGERLDSEVCSIYLLRNGKLELFATRGLNQSAVHVTKLGIGDGLTGTIAKNIETLNLAEAASHPAFQYRPETGEERFHSFAGVPIVYRERAVGVLNVQHIEPRRYAEVEVEALQTTAMVLSELIAHAELVDGEAAGTASHNTAPEILEGLKLNGGLGAGTAVFHQPSVTIDKIVADDTEEERRRVYEAFAKMRDQIDDLASQPEFGSGSEQAEVLETYKMFAYDEGWSRRINEAIESGLTAEAAIERVQQHTRMRMREIDDPLLADRMHDLEDLSNRLLRIVSGQMGTAATQGLRRDTILIARNLGPAELLEYDRRRLKGVILQEGSLTAHVVIVARAMGIPVLGRVSGLRGAVYEGDEILLDGERAQATVRPTAPMLEAFAARSSRSKEKREHYARMRDVEPFTRDGTRIEVMMNAGLREDIRNLAAVGADGIGLFRTEFQFLVASAMPQRERQFRLYRDVLDAAGDKPVVFRTVDIGGDKALPYLANDAEDAEENPAMGWRALRLALEREALFKGQARALIEAGGGRDLYVMFPLVSTPSEFAAAKALFEQQVEHLRSRDKVLPKAVHYGAMFEVPALAEVLDILLPQLSFLSIGTNDLSQFFFAADRANPKLATRYDVMNIAFLRFIRRIVIAAQSSGVNIGLCGEMGGRRLDALALLGLGVRRFSITPASVGAVKELIQQVDLPAITAFMDRLIACPHEDIRTALEVWSRKNDIDID